MKEKILVIFNPVAGQRNYARVRSLVLAQLSEKGEVEAVETHGAGDAFRAAQRARADNYNLVVAVGGDGTVMEAASALIGGKIPLGIIPNGTTNALSFELGIPARPKQAARLITGSHAVIDLDVGKVGDRYFAIMAGAGWDAALIRDAHRELKNRFGLGAYIIAGVTNLVKTKEALFTIEIDDRPKERVRGMSVIIANVGTVGPSIAHLGPHIHAQDGLLDVCIFAPRSFWGMFRIVALILTKRYNKTSRIRYITARRVVINAYPPMPVQMDGESLGQTPLIAEAVPAALPIIVPLYRAEEMSHTLKQAKRKRSKLLR